MIQTKSISYVEVYLEGYGRKFTSGNDIVSCQVSLGQDDKSSSCTVTVLDKDSSIAAALVKHSLENGGIQSLPDAPKPVVGADSTIANTSYASNPSSQQDWKAAIVRECVAQRVTDINQIAYILATAQGESTMGANMTELASGAAYEGNRGLGNTQPGDGKRFKG